MKPTNNQHTTRIAVVGVGNVGTSAAYALTLGGIAEDLLLVDIRASVRDSLVRDLSDVAHGIKSRTRVRAATYQEVGQCDIVVLTPGSERSPGG
ncbi:lactate/malate dehydrogenase [Aspergillus nomiae NRRL 13137]|uniref:Lactate/malate dehydrogenase n=1 Tax=Aspergillus nomiae NRRL (strain ATCC 15546 / NRRL 13137 / CBS 260.88 / M93) TaxID=1509407 RepID=A0A0L1JGK4_ASPN3|nr:lactate/malate dehydrogenase [Aspergillus nomiae NRRL 13137]KNG90891.1 lactate/malate dehydrogenase [Aspergillus nomiae NRRL 13137]